MSDCKKEKRTKKLEDRRQEKQKKKEEERLKEEKREQARQERKREMAESEAAAERERKRIQKTLKRQAREEATHKKDTPKKPRIEKVDVPPNPNPSRSPSPRPHTPPPPSPPPTTNEEEKKAEEEKLREEEEQKKLDEEIAEEERKLAALEEEKRTLKEAQEKQIEEEKRQAEQREEEEKKAEKERQRSEEKRKAEEAQKAEDERLKAEEKKRAEDERKAKESQEIEENRLRAEQERAEAEARQQSEEEKRRQEELKKIEEEKQPSPERAPPSPPRSTRQTITIETVEGDFERIEIRSQGNGRMNGGVPNGKAMEAEVTSTTTTPLTSISASQSTSTTAPSSTTVPITLPPIVSIDISLPTPIPTSIPIPALTPTRTETLPLTTPLTEAQVDIPTTSTPHTDPLISATVPAPTAPGPHVHISTQAQTSVASFLPSLHTYPFTAPGTYTLGAPSFLQSSTRMTEVPMGHEAAMGYNPFTGEAFTPVTAWDVSQAYQMPYYESDPMYVQPMGGIIGGTAMISQILGFINNQNQMSQQYQMGLIKKQNELQQEVDDLIETQNYMIEVVEDKRNQLEMTQEAHKELSQQFYTLKDEIKQEKGKNQLYKLQLEELGSTVRKERIEHIQELNDERCYSYETHLLKEKEVETAKRAMAMTRRRLQQAEDTIRTFMDHPTEDPMTLDSRDARIRRLEEENRELRQLNQVVHQSMMHRLLHESKENKELKHQIQELQRHISAQPSLLTSTTSSTPLLQAPSTIFSQPLPATTTQEQTPMDTGTNIAGTSSPVRDNNTNDFDEEQGDGMPSQTAADKEFMDRLNRESSKQLKECMEWEHKILESAALTMLTPKDIQQNYRTPQLPLPILKLQVKMLKTKLLPQCPTNELGGYAEVPIKDYEVMDIELNQPKWRKTWMTHSKFHKLHYVNAPQEIRIDPTFCPVRRRRDWATFNRIATGERQTWLNYPVLQAPPPKTQPTERYVVSTLRNVLQRMENLPDLSCMMLVKIARMLLMVITAFKELPKAGPHWTTYFEGPDGFAWNLQNAPSKEILMGIYGRCIYLPSHFLNTFEEAFYTGFFEVHTEIFSSTNQNPLSRYVAFRRTEVEHPLQDVAMEAERQVAIDWFKRGLTQERSGR